ncbi:response regulator [Ruoffia tabacinasalis]|uniref:Transcriptional regulatory protein n=1 Tax=Ruoffia tabacinasalis TaxID=87458 RepID=A0ABS0LKZ5_9LACT|nr:response regulator [Ruoffia tabacinasalis]MBG9978966.1 response regulator [Ruoffia tabacinasalis]
MKFNVLIVEDDPMVSLINQRYVERVSNFSVLATVPSLIQAQDILLTQAIDLVLIDINLKSESGIDLVRWIRSQNISTEFIIISAENRAKTVEIAASFGAIDYILKPFKFERFKQSLNQFKQKSLLIQQREVFNQEELDKLYWTHFHADDIQSQPLEKGISHKTLKHILNIISQINQPFTIEELTQQANLSHVTVRKYIQFLLDNQHLVAETIYGEIGRPTTLYKSND